MIEQLDGIVLNGPYQESELNDKHHPYRDMEEVHDWSNENKFGVPFFFCWGKGLFNLP